ncbi:MAG TPA: hypothetical protein VJS38_05950 [Phenylobacterium sp.]|uniref:hypothetical protein n=1 Tax=Phenylobacterium sp. TaxID=1871053 RepID=UPI002B4A8A57|nr:hypothetical protein [Phenylobacterium sp.]HKR87700.1 hypothetical protein [Phenylobacterium sp.]
MAESASPMLIRLNDLQRQLDEVRQSKAPLETGSGGGDSMGMDARVTKLETHMEYVRKDLDAISGKLDKLVENTSQLPTKRDLTTNTFAAIGIGFAVMAIVVGGIIGGLGWIQSRVSPAPAATPVASVPAASAPAAH